jgi:hypothetical protein
MDKVLSLKKGDTHRRWATAVKDENFESILDLALLETNADHFLKVLADGKVSSNIYLRRIHNFARAMDWLLNIYEARMKRGSFALEKNDVQAARQVRRLLKRAKFYIPPDSIHVIRNGERVRLVFVFPFGAVGIVRQKRQTSKA